MKMTSPKLCSYLSSFVVLVILLDMGMGKGMASSSATTKSKMTTTMRGSDQQCNNGSISGTRRLIAERMGMADEQNDEEELWMESETTRRILADCKPVSASDANMQQGQGFCDGRDICSCMNPLPSAPSPTFTRCKLGRCPD